MPDDKPVKLVREKLDAAAVTAHLADVAAHATEIECRIKGAVESYSDASTDAVAEIARRLVAGEIVAAQVRYRRDEAWWTDTVMRANAVFRLVRMRDE